MGGLIAGGVELRLDSDPVTVTKIKISRDFSGGDCEGRSVNQMNLCEVQLLPAEEAEE